MKMLRRLPLFVSLLVGIACGGDVAVGDDGGNGGFAASDGMGADGGTADPTCSQCGLQSCGHCGQTSATGTVFACRGSGPPVAGKVCYQTGSVFYDDQGPYICWNCE